MSNVATAYQTHFQGIAGAKYKDEVDVTYRFDPGRLIPERLLGSGTSKCTMACSAMRGIETELDAGWDDRLSMDHVIRRWSSPIVTR